MQWCWWIILDIVLHVRFGDTCVHYFRMLVDLFLFFRRNWICCDACYRMWCGTRYVKVPWYIVTQLTRLGAVVSLVWSGFHLIVFIQTQNGWSAGLWARVFRFLQVASVEDRADFYPLWGPSWGCSWSRHQPPPDVGGGPKRGDPDSYGWFDR